MIQQVGKISRSREIRFLMMILFAGAAVIILIQGGSQLFALSVRLDPLLVLLSFMISSAGLLLCIATWRLILAGYGVRQTVRDDLRIYAYSMLGVVLPGGIWTIASRAALYNRLGANTLRVTTASVVETFLTGIGALAVYAVTAIVQPGTELWQRPELGVGVAILFLFLVHPSVFNPLCRWILNQAGQGHEALQVNFSLRELGMWIALETLVVTIGGGALFVLLNSLIATPTTVLVQMISAWAAAVAISNLLFWLPGTAVLRDGVMILALSPSLPVAFALIFVMLARIWAIASILLIAGLIWLLLDRPKNAIRLWKSHV